MSVSWLTWSRQDVASQQGRDNALAMNRFGSGQG